MSSDIKSPSGAHHLIMLALSVNRLNIKKNSFISNLFRTIRIQLRVF